MLKKELVSPQKPSFCSSRPSNSEALCLFPGIENSSPKSCISLSKISFMKLYIHLNRRECVLLSWSIRDDGREEEMVQKENNILIDETRTDLRQGFHRIHSSSSFLPRLSFYLQASMLAVLTTLSPWKENHCCLQTYEAKKSSLSLAWMNCKSFEVLNFVFNCVTAHPLCSSNDLQLVSSLKFQASENLRCQICPHYDISQAT